MSNTEYIYIGINAILYTGYALWYWKHTRSFTIGMFLISIWTASAVFGLLYEPNNFIGHYHKLQLWPFFFMFALNLIAFYPILKFRHDKIIYYKANTRIIIFLGIALGLLSILPLIENIIYAVAHASDSGFNQLLQNMDERYEDKTYECLNYLSAPAFYCSRLLGWFGLNLITLLLVSFPLFINLKKHKLAFAGIICANINYILESINTFARFNIAVQLAMFLCAYIIIYKFYSSTTRKIINKYTAISMVSILSIFFVLSMYRLKGWNEDSSSSNQGMIIYIGQYFCEGMLNFSADRSRAEVFDRIEEMERGVRISLLREKKIAKNRAKTAGYRGELIGPQFSTWIGNFYLSMGPILIFVVFFLVAWWIYGFVPKGNILTFAHCYLIIAYLRMMILGICYNTYAVSSDELSGEIIMIPLLFLFEILWSTRNVIVTKH